MKLRKGKGPEAYVSYLEAHALPTKGATEEGNLRVGDWSFYYRAPDGPRQDSVALDTDDHEVGDSGRQDWYEFLSEPAMDADTAHRRISWLLMRPAPVDQDYPFNNPEAAAMVTEPNLERAEGSVRFAGWVIYPPATEEPFLLTIEARPGQATLESVAWSRLPKD